MPCLYASDYGPPEPGFDPLVGSGRLIKGLEERRQTDDRRGHVRDNAERALERSDDAGARPARKTGGQHIENAGAALHDDDQRRHQKLDAHVNCS
jgi:hypothetical protein